MTFVNGMRLVGLGVLPILVISPLLVVVNASEDGANGVDRKNQAVRSRRIRCPSIVARIPGRQRIQVDLGQFRGEGQVDLAVEFRYCELRLIGNFGMCR